MWPCFVVHSGQWSQQAYAALYWIFMVWIGRLKMDNYGGNDMFCQAVLISFGL